MAKQLVKPNPNIPCKPGWCLQYVREAFGIYPGVYPSATAGWANAQYKHPGELPPRGVWTPVWFYMKDEPLGHVVLSAPDGSIYSTSDPSTVPHHHPNLADLMGYYAYWGLPLTYLGWSEDIETVRVVEVKDTIEYSGEITPQPQEEDDMFNDDDRKLLTAVKEALIDGGKSMLYGASIQKLIDDIPRRTAFYPVIRDGVKVAWIQDTADGVTMLENLQDKVLPAMAEALKIDPATVRSAFEDAVKGSKLSVTIGGEDN